MLHADGSRGKNDFNPRSPCGERHPILADLRLPVEISIHAPLAGSDSASRCSWRTAFYFNPRSPCGERRVAVLLGMSSMRFQSTLPLRGATDCRRLRPRTRRHFNPRSPCGERPFCSKLTPTKTNFNPRSPCGERPEAADMGRRRGEISIHAPLAGSDSFP